MMFSRGKKNFLRNHSVKRTAAGCGHVLYWPGMSSLSGKWLQL